MTHISCFSGIGGDSLAARWAGFETLQMVEIDSFCQKVLGKNFPQSKIHGDITTFDGRSYKGRCDLLTGGFPCQDISTASRNPNAKGLQGSKSGLFWELMRVVKQIEPTWVVLENVRQLKSRGLSIVQRELEETGYITESLLLGAGSTGATHQRLLFFVVGYSNSYSKPIKAVDDEASYLSELEEFSRRKITARNVRRYDGIPRGVDGHRLRAYGNAICPQQILPILKAIAFQINPLDNSQNLL